MLWLQSIVLGIVQGITEWLPVSSTGHLLIVQRFWPVEMSVSALNLFNVVIQLGSIIAVMVLWFHTLNPFSGKKSASEKKSTWMLWAKIAAASVPVAIIGFLLDDFVDSKLHSIAVIAFALAFYGVVFLIVERREKPAKVTSLEEITFTQAVKIGFFESLAIVPGTSRSGATILGGLLTGLDRPTASRFSFFMAVPVMFGASFLKILKLGSALTSFEWALVAVGFVVSFVVSLFTLKALVGYVKSHTFRVFGIYRIVLALFLLLSFKG